jgi:hypothetical protein
VEVVEQHPLARADLLGQRRQGEVRDAVLLQVFPDRPQQFGIKEYLRENFYGGILAGDFANQESGAVDPSWSLSYNAYLGMVNLIGIDRVLFTADYPYANMKAAHQFLDQMPINPGDKEKIAHLRRAPTQALKVRSSNVIEREGECHERP